MRASVSRDGKLGRLLNAGRWCAGRVRGNGIGGGEVITGTEAFGDEAIMSGIFPGSFKGEWGIGGVGIVSTGVDLNDSDGAEVRFANGSSSRRKSRGGEVRAELKVKLLFLALLSTPGWDESGPAVDTNVEVDALGDVGVAAEWARILDVSAVGLGGGEVVGESVP